MMRGLVLVLPVPAGVLVARRLVLLPRRSPGVGTIASIAAGRRWS
jgi:hypothetical protein